MLEHTVRQARRAWTENNFENPNLSVQHIRWTPLKAPMSRPFILITSPKSLRSMYCKRAVVRECTQFSSVAQSCPTLCDPMNRSSQGLPVYHQLPEFTKPHVHPVSNAIQPSHPLSSPPPPAPNPSQNQGLFHWVNSSHEVAKLLEFQHQHQSFQ